MRGVDGTFAVGRQGHATWKTWAPVPVLVGGHRPSFSADDWFCCTLHARALPERSLHFRRAGGRLPELSRRLSRLRLPSSALTPFKSKSRIHSTRGLPVAFAYNI
eukprot:scaffold182964_cov30-Tisochrysis_lutea.AAC.3